MSQGQGLKFWTCDQLALKNKNSPTQNKIRHLKRHLNWYAKLRLKSLSVRYWKVHDFANAIMTISTYREYANSTVDQKIILLFQILASKGITTVLKKEYIFRHAIRCWFNERKLGKARAM